MKTIREILWLNHGCSLDVLYGDDGEMQCNNTRKHPMPIDFKRDSLIEIDHKLSERTPCAYGDICGPSSKDCKDCPHGD